MPDYSSLIFAILSIASGWVGLYVVMIGVKLILKTIRGDG
jgi:hypothetical protein